MTFFANRNFLPRYLDKRSQKLIGLQLLRAIAALLVVLHHATNEFWATHGIDGPFHWGVYGVDLFFVLSGTVMWISTRSSIPGSKTAIVFLLRRWIRIFPIYWILTLGFAAAIVLAPTAFRSISLGDGRFWKSLLVLPQMHLPLLVVGWSLTFEVFFYLLFALGLLHKIIQNGVAVALLAIGVSGLFLEGRFQSPWLSTLLNSYHLEFLAGMLCGHLLSKDRLPNIWFNSAILLAAISVAYLDGPRAIWCGLMFFSMVCQFLHWEDFFENGGYIFRLLGDASYSLYLVHMPIIVVLHRATPVGHLSFPMALLLCVLICQIAAIVCWQIMERPILMLLLRQLKAKFDNA